MIYKIIGFWTLGLVFFGTASWLFPSHGLHSEPSSVLKAACSGWDCQAMVSKHLPLCEKNLSHRLTKTVVNGSVTKEVPTLTFDVMQDLIDCIARAEGTAFDASSLDLTRFFQTRVVVRGSTDSIYADNCQDATCSEMGMLPIIGETRLLYGPR